MSAFLCSEEHLAAIATWAAAEGLTDDPVSLCIVLRRLNNAALAARYGDAPQVLQDIGAALRDATATPRSAAEVFALVRCLHYQCNEGDVMQQHRNRGTLLALLAAAESAAPDGKPADLWSI
jgi:hypothetical protein